MKKHNLREIYLKKRSDLSSDHLDEVAHKVKENFFNIHSIEQWWCFHSYLPKQGELSTLPLIEKLRLHGKTIVASKTHREEKKMSHYIYNPQQIVTGAWGIPEPKGGVQVMDEQIEVAIIPLLVADKLGYRVGYGQGFYDRFLAVCSPKMIKVGLSIFDPIEKIEDTDTYDIPLSFLVTPEKTWAF